MFRMRWIPILALLVIDFGLSQEVVPPTAFPNNPRLSGFDFSQLDDMTVFLSNDNKRLTLFFKFVSAKGEGQQAEGVQVQASGSVSIDGTIRPDLIKLETVFAFFSAHFLMKGPFIREQLVQRGFPVEQLDLLEKGIREPATFDDHIGLRVHQQLAASEYAYFFRQSLEEKARVSDQTVYEICHYWDHLNQTCTAQVLASIFEPLNGRARRVLYSYIYETRGAMGANYMGQEARIREHLLDVIRTSGSTYLEDVIAGLLK